MPIVVRLAGYAGLCIWTLVLLVFVLNLVAIPAQPSSATDARVDSIAIPVGLAISIAGMAVSVGMLRGKTWAYRGFVATLTLVALSVGSVVFVGMPVSVGSGALIAICVLMLILRSLLIREPVRALFGNEPVRNELLRLPGWINVAFGSSGLVVSLWPLPIAVFGIWLTEMQARAVNASFGIAYLLLGLGMLTCRRWIWPAALAVCCASALLSAGQLWELNPGGKLSKGEAVAPETALKGAALGLAVSGWVLWRILLYRRTGR